MRRAGNRVAKFVLRGDLMIPANCFPRLENGRYHKDLSFPVDHGGRDGRQINFIFDHERKAVSFIQVNPSALRGTPIHGAKVSVCICRLISANPIFIAACIDIYAAEPMPITLSGIYLQNHRLICILIQKEPFWSSLSVAPIQEY